MGWHVKGDEISREYCGDLFVEDSVIENTSEGKKKSGLREAKYKRESVEP